MHPGLTFSPALATVCIISPLLHPPHTTLRSEAQLEIIVN